MKTLATPVVRGVITDSPKIFKPMLSPRKNWKKAITDWKKADNAKTEHIFLKLTILFL